jgi:hypothetical protein
VNDQLKCSEGDKARIIFDETRQDLIGVRVTVLYRATAPEAVDPSGRRHYVHGVPCWMVEFSEPVVLWGETSNGAFYQTASRYAVAQDRCLMPERRPAPKNELNTRGS